MVEEAMDRAKHENYMRAKQLLNSLGYITISYDQFNSMQKKIIELGHETESITKMIEQGFALMTHIYEVITYNNEVDAQKGNFGLPIDVIKQMDEFTQLLHDTYDKYLPLIRD